MKNILIALLLIVLPVSICSAANLVDITCSHGDTIYAGYPCEIQFWIENNDILYGFNWGSRFGISGDITWSYISQGDSGFGFNYHAVTDIPGSRAYPSHIVFDLAGMWATEYNMDGIGMDSMIIGGAALLHGLPPGPLEHMYSLHFVVDTDVPFDLEYFTYDTCKIGSDDNAFITMTNTIIPTTLWPAGGITIPIVNRGLIAGDANMDRSLNIGDAVFLVNYIFNQGEAPFNANCADANADCSVNIGDAVYLITYIFKGGPAPVLSDCAQ